LLEYCYGATANQTRDPAAALRAAKRAHVALQTLYIFVLPSARLYRNLIYHCE